MCEFKTEAQRVRLHHSANPTLAISAASLRLAACANSSPAWHDSEASWEALANVRCAVAHVGGIVR